MSRARDFYRANTETLGLIYGAVLGVVAIMAVATGVAFAVTSIHSGQLARASCRRSVKYGPYLARLYDTDFPAPDRKTFRVMPHDAAVAYARSIPKHC